MSDPWPVLTIRQPWCWAIMHGGKHVENRSWSTSYRGPLWLHAGARSRWDPAATQFPLLQSAWNQHVRRIPSWPGLPVSDVELGRRTTLMPFGAVAALAQATGCHHATGCPAGEDGAPWPLCTPWSARDQFHIELADVRLLPHPVPCHGKLGLWRLPAYLHAVALGQLEVTHGDPDTP